MAAARPRARRNPPFVTIGGVRHPIRHELGAAYSERSLQKRARRREDLLVDTLELQRRRRDRRYAEAAEAKDRLRDVQYEQANLKAELKSDPVTGLTGLIRRAGKERGEVNRIPFAQARPILGRYLGRSPESFVGATVKDASGRKYLRWEYCLDELAENLGYYGSDELKEAIEGRARDKARLEDLTRELAELKAQARYKPKPTSKAKKTPAARRPRVIVKRNPTTSCRRTYHVRRGTGHLLKRTGTLSGRAHRR